jgi:hypothetical protein
MFDYPIEIVQYVDKTQSIFSQSLSPTTTELVLQYPSILGKLNLFEMKNNGKLSLSPSFQQLIYSLVLAGELDPQILNVQSLPELNTILQKEQGAAGGMLRNKQKERWELSDSHILLNLKPLLLSYFYAIGFFQNSTVESSIEVDHIIVYGARCERMEKRILETLGYLENFVLKGDICLIGSTRLLVEEEKVFLNTKLDNLSEEDKIVWSNKLNDEPFETTAQQFLWYVLAQSKYADSLVVIASSKIFPSENRPNAQSTTEAWVSTGNFQTPQNIFAFVEQPYQRLNQQLFLAVITNAGTADINLITERLENTTFYFVTKPTGKEPLISIYLDEIARNVNLLTQYLEYLEYL